MFNAVLPQLLAPSPGNARKGSAIGARVLSSCICVYQTTLFVTRFRPLLCYASTICGQLRKGAGRGPGDPLQADSAARAEAGRLSPRTLRSPALQRARRQGSPQVP